MARKSKDEVLADIFGRECVLQEIEFGCHEVVMLSQFAICCLSHPFIGLHYFGCGSRLMGSGDCMLKPLPT